MKYQGTDIDIKEVQQVQTEILLEFDRICRKNDIPYQLMAGTLLGAVRHKGFIPWDDDVDVCLLRPDYERFINCCANDITSDYFLQHLATDRNSIFQYAKMRKNNTIFINTVDKDSKMHTGIYIDIFPLDNVMPSTIIGRLHSWCFKVLYIISSSRLRGRAMNAKNKFNRTIRLFLFYFLKLIPKAFIDQLTQKALRMFEKKDTEYVNHLTNGVSKKRLKQYLRKRDTFYDIEYGEFNGYMLPIPKNYHCVLTTQFGDYMELPPEKDRYPHHGIIEVAFDTQE